MENALIIARKEFNKERIASLMLNDKIVGHTTASEIRKLRKKTKVRLLGKDEFQSIYLIEISNTATGKRSLVEKIHYPVGYIKTKQTSN